MKTRLFALLALSTLLLAGCTAGQPDLTKPPPSVPPSKSTTTQAGPGLWPTGMPAPPSPTITPTPLSAISTVPSREAETAKALPSTIPSTSTVATSTTAGWTTYESINNIYDLAFAPDGTLWTVTSGGLVHWNLKAQTYTRYPIQAGALAIAPDGTLWLVLKQGEVCHFDDASCETCPRTDGLMGNAVYTIAVAPDGIVWVGTERGVSRFDGDSWKSYPSPVATHDLAVAADGEVWAATAGGVGRYLPAEDEWITYTEDHGLPGSSAQVIAVGPDGEVLAYLVWQGVYRFDSAGWQKVNKPHDSLSDMAFADDGTPWVATAGSTYSGGSLSFHDGTQWRDVASDQELYSFTSIALGPEGVVAASTQLGLGLYERGDWHLLRDGPTSHSVTSVAVTPDGAAWFAFGENSTFTPGWGLSRFDGQEWDYLLGDAEVNALAVGPDGTLWAGVGCSVQRFDGTAWEIVARCEDLPAGGVIDIDCTPDGAVWVTNGLGLARFDGGSWIVYQRQIDSLIVAPDGSVWVNGWEGAQDSSYIAHFDSGSWTLFKTADSWSDRFIVRAVTADGLLWGTIPKGRLSSFDGKSCTFYDPPASLGLDGTNLLTIDPDEALWLAADDAMIRFEPGSTSDEAWTLYTQDDGLPDSYYRNMAFGPDGEIWFGTTRFRPPDVPTAP